MDYAIEVRNLIKTYGDLIAVDGLSVRIRSGICFGILGPNGAGKTSFMEILEGLRSADSGEVTIQNLNQKNHLREIQQLLGVQLQENHYFRFLNLEQLLKFFIGAYPNSKATPESLLAEVGLVEKKEASFEQLSGGQKQRFSLAVALASDPHIIFFDEPTTGLDPQNRQYIWQLVRNLKTRGKTIVLTTHYMEEAEQLCDELMIMDHGRLIAQGAPTELVQQIQGSHSISLNMDVKLSEEELASLPGVAQARANLHGVGFRLWTGNLLQTIQSIQELTQEKQTELAHFEVDRVTLEDVFLNLTGRELRE